MLFALPYIGVLRSAQKVFSLHASKGKAQATVTQKLENRRMIYLTA